MTAAADGGYRVIAGDGEILCRSVVIASGACNAPHVPALRAAVPSSVASFTPFDYRNPAQLPEGGVLVVGASATGAQLADEIRRSGRRVVLSVGEHVRLPRMYRGRDVLWWMEASGVWNQRYDEIDDLVRARRLPSPQLVGTPEHATLDLNTLSAAGVELVGRLSAIRDGRALFSGGLRNLFALADLKMERLLDTFDEWARSGACDSNVGPVERFEPTRVPAKSPLELDLNGGAIRSIVWATGFRPEYGWLQVPVVDHKGHLRHDGGVVDDAPGLYAIGLARAAAAQVDVHRGRRGRRARRRRASRGLSRSRFTPLMVGRSFSRRQATRIVLGHHSRRRRASNLASRRRRKPW